MLSLPDDDSYTQAEADDEESYAQEEDPSLTPSLPPEEPSITLPSLPLTDSEENESLLSILIKIVPIIFSKPLLIYSWLITVKE